jgi:zinc/manganese transport system permease protein
MITALAQPQLTWNVVDDVRSLFDYPFMVNALRAGTIIAVMAGVVGWFMVLRRQTFAGHTLALIGFPGGAGAVLVGAGAQLGFFAFSIAGAVVIATLPSGARSHFTDEGAVIGTVQAFALACGFLFVSLNGANLNGINALLFGSLLGVTDADVARLAAAATVVLVVVGLIARPLLFASVDPDVAESRGVPVGRLTLGFTLLLGLAAAASTEITGSLLVFALLVLPAATAQTIATRPATSLLLSVGVALVVTWVGLGIAYYSPYPVGFWITTIAFAVFVATRLLVGLTTRTRWRVAP